MENTVNSRILLLKKELNLTTVEFCAKAQISTGTFSNIKNGENVNHKTIKSIVSGFNVNQDWLQSGKGKMFNAEVKAEAQTPWKDEAYNNLQRENSRLEKELERVWSMVQSFMGNKANFRKALDVAGLPMLFPGKQSRVRATT